MCVARRGVGRGRIRSGVQGVGQARTSAVVSGLHDRLVHERQPVQRGPDPGAGSTVPERGHPGPTVLGTGSGRRPSIAIRNVINVVMVAPRVARIFTRELELKSCECKSPPIRCSSGS